MDINRIGWTTATLGVIATAGLSAPCTADWWEDFDSYATGSLSLIHIFRAHET